jgi:hypothetical protein
MKVAVRAQIATRVMFAAAFFAAGLEARGDEAATCATAGACVAALRAAALADDSLGVGQREMGQVARLVPFGARAAVR